MAAMDDHSWHRAGHAPRRFARHLPSPVPPHPGDALLTERRAELFRQVLARRCARLAVVLEDCHDPHNASAVLRSCDAFGLHRVHVVAARADFKVNPRITNGAHRHLDLRVHDDIGAAYAQLRGDGYAIRVSDLAAEALAGPQQLAAELAQQPLALVFGSEGFGVSPAAVAGADGCFLIPMAGFAQSLNLSVSVAVSLYALRGSALAEDRPGDLSSEQQTAIYDAWLRRDHPAAIAALEQARSRDGQQLEVWRAEQGGAPS